MQELDGPCPNHQRDTASSHLADLPLPSTPGYGNPDLPGQSGLSL